MSDKPAKILKTDEVGLEQLPRKWYWVRTEGEDGQEMWTKVWHTVWRSLTLTRRSDSSSHDQRNEATASSSAASRPNAKRKRGDSPH